MGIIRIYNNGEADESDNHPDGNRDQNQDETYRREIERQRREMPDLQIVEIVPTPEKNNEVPPPWIIQGILDSIEDDGKKNDNLPN